MESTNQSLMKYRWILPFLFLLSCSKGYHYKYWFFPYYEDQKIDTSERRNFKIVDKEFARDEKNVYYKETTLPGVEPETFRILEKGYFSDRKKVYFVSTHLNIRTNSPKAWLIIIPLDLKIWTEKKIVFSVVEKAKPESFRVLDRDGIFTDYGLDEDRLYYLGGILEENAQSIAFLQSFFFEVLKTKNSIYYNGNRIREADPNTFELFDRYAKDRKRCYYLTSGEPISFSCSSENFVVLKYSNPLDSKISLDSDYAKDSDFVFWKGKAIPGADPKSIQLIPENGTCPYYGACAEDRNRKFKEGEAF
ncbi:DKNYY domain-containing protein [Leptospira stimsonii]|uniref:Uncharacterized protein n=1 Tax=Leptospira stimsonii TaxID=2202203 RepID=A0A396ZEE1_9LEPT|nr:DKNYY domain-containing protein [Leptospira stimsonii]RHX92885.1 hypothetical protein DLM75_06895 [Leptospira stimsonii]